MVRLLLLFWSLLLLLLLLVVHVPAQQQQGEICTLFGQDFQAGDPLGDLFTTRCGSASEFPCYCNPQADPPIDCPYCGIATSTGLVCAQAGEESILIVNLQGVAQDCTCQIDFNTGLPESVCQDDVCNLELDDGSFQSFANGESYGEFLTTRCGLASEYPCFCNTDLPNQIDCPYCGYVTNTGDLSCARIDETIIYRDPDNQQIQCTCREDLSSSCGGISTTSQPTMRPTGNPTPSPIYNNSTPNPTSSPVQAPSTSAPVPSPNPPPPSTEAPVPTLSPALPPIFNPAPTQAPATLQPTVMQTNAPTKGTPSTLPPASMPIKQPTTFDKPTVLLPNRPPVSSPISSPVAPPPSNGCSYNNIEDSSTEFVQTGESFGKHVTGLCSPWEDWPTFCNPQLPGNQEYPYCVFSPSGEEEEDFLVCARSGERVLVPTSDGSIEECSCLFLNPFIGAVSSCPDLMVDWNIPTTAAPSEAPSEMPSTQSPTDMPSTAAGNSPNPPSSSSSPSPRVLGGLSMVLWIAFIVGGPLLW